MIFDGSSEIDMIYDGSAEVQAVYDGATEIWTNFKVINLGNGTSFDIKNYTNKWAELTNSNFFILSASNASGTDGTGTVPAGSSKWGDFGFNAILIKSYDKSTGILTAYNAIRNDSNGVAGRGNVVAVMVIKTSKLIYLGWNTSFSVTSYANYKKFTNDNFLIVATGNPGHSNGYYQQETYAYSDSGSGTSSISKSYNSNTGVLTAKINMSSRGTTPPYTYYNANVDGNVEVYLNPKV